jgi:hypothetical protein
MSNVAIKIISKRRAPADYIEKFLPREINIVKILKHPNLVVFLQVRWLHGCRLSSLGRYKAYGISSRAAAAELQCCVTIGWRRICRKLAG